VHPLQQSWAPPPGSRQVIQVNSSFDVDGRRLANAVSHHVALGAEIINSAAMFDGRMTPMSVDMGVP